MAQQHVVFAKTSWKFKIDADKPLCIEVIGDLNQFPSTDKIPGYFPDWKTNKPMGSNVAGFSGEAFIDQDKSLKFRVSSWFDQYIFEELSE